MATTVDKVHIVLMRARASVLTGFCTIDQRYRGRDGQDPKEQGYELPSGSIESQIGQAEAGASYTTVERRRGRL